MRRPKIPHYYGRLKVAPDAPPEVIRAAYKALAQKYHPDRHRGSIRHAHVLAALNKAADVLLDPERRAAHDQWIRQEEMRIGYRDADFGPRPGLGERLRQVWSGVRDEHLSFGQAAQAYLTGRQRFGVATAGVMLLSLCVAGTLLLLAPRDDMLSGLATSSSDVGKALSAADAASSPH